MSVVQFARLIANFEIFLELTDEEELDLDNSVEFGEYLCGELESFDEKFLREFIDAIAIIEAEYTGNARKIVHDIPFAYYLEEQLAEGDLAKMAELEAIRDARED